VTAADMALFLERLFRSPAGYACRADLNGDGLVNSGDLALMLEALIEAGSTSSAGPWCP
jgi:hypothetical protein